MKRVISQVLIVVLMLLVISACSQEPPENPYGFTAPLVVTPTKTPTATHTPTATNTPTSMPDLRLGYTDRGMNCPLITEIVELALEQELGLSVERIKYETADGLFGALAKRKEEREIDLTLCFLDREDRPYIQRYFHDINPIGDAYRQNEWLIMINVALVVPLRGDCVYRFFENIEFEDTPFQEQDAKTWIQNHSDEVQSWKSCEP